MHRLQSRIPRAVVQTIHGCAKDQEITDLRAQLAGAETEVSGLRASVMSAHEEIAQLQQRVTDRDSKIEELERKNRLIAEREESDARRFDWFFGPRLKVAFFVKYPSEVTSKFTPDQWRAAIDEAMKQSEEKCT